MEWDLVWILKMFILIFVTTSWTATLINIHNKLLPKHDSNVKYQPLLCPDQALDLYLGDGFPSSTLDSIPTNTFNIDYARFPDTHLKVQDRHKEIKNSGKKAMCLDPKQSKIELLLQFIYRIDWKQIMSVVLKVKRAMKTTGCYEGFVNLDPAQVIYSQNNPGSNGVSVSADLGKIMEGHWQHDIYKLSRNSEKFNEFYVKVEVYFIDGSPMSSTDTRNFTVRNKAKEGGGVKRRRECSESPCQFSPASSSGYSSNGGDPHNSQEYLRLSRLVVDKIEGKCARFDNLYSKVLKSGNGDIAYHFVLKDQENPETFEPGEVIGFTTNVEGKLVVQKLTNKMDNIFLKGVVTENQYIEANIPEDENVVTATICMLGIVPVFTIGPVYAGDSLLASHDIAGVASPEDYVEHTQQETLLGCAFEDDDCPDDEIREVKAFVSILGGAALNHMKRGLTCLEKSLKEDITVTSSRNRKRYYIIAILGILISIAAAIGLYQRYGIGTMYQRWECRRGSTGTSEYWYWLQGHMYRGVRFDDCKTVWRKTTNDRRFYKRPKHIHNMEAKEICLNGTYHYYINLESCTGVLNPGARYMYAVDDACTKVYRFDEIYGSWEVDLKVCASPRCNLYCSHKKYDPKEECNPNAKCPHSTHLL